MGMRGARRGESSEWVRYLWAPAQVRPPPPASSPVTCQRISPAPPRHIPVSRVLVELAELPVDGEDEHVVVLLEIVFQQVQGVVAGLQPLLVLVDLLHLRDGGHGRAGERVTSCSRTGRRLWRAKRLRCLVSFQTSAACLESAQEIHDARSGVLECCCLATRGNAHRCQSPLCWFRVASCSTL